MGRNSISLMAFVFAFGLLLGASLLIGFNFFHNENLSEQYKRPAIEYTTGTERLEAYKCAELETKHIIMGGVEDNFSPDHEENIHIFANQNQELFSQSQTQKIRNYDEAGQNKIFVSRFDVPSRTYHGIVALRIKELSSFRNDGLSLYLQDPQIAESGKEVNLSHFQIWNLEENGWNREGDHFWARLDSLKVQIRENNQVKQSESVPTFLKAIRRQSKDQDVIVRISDDTQVDFVGFALCLEPAKKMAVVYSSRNTAHKSVADTLPDNLVYLSQAIVNGKSCTYGCRSCDAVLPISCIRDIHASPPEGLGDFKALWAGGEIKFSKPVSGEDLVTEDDVDGRCKAEFGDGWRHMNIKDGAYEGKVIGYGQVPENYDEFWVGVKNSPHFTCWEQRMDYSVMAKKSKVP